MSSFSNKHSVVQKYKLDYKGLPLAHDVRGLNMVGSTKNFIQFSRYKPAIN